jgi:hypothetical protein
MAYLVITTARIQGYLDDTETVNLVATEVNDEDYAISKAEFWEGDVVRRQTKFLSHGWFFDSSGPWPDELKDTLAMEVAADICFARYRTKFGVEGLLWWGDRFRAEVQNRLNTYYTNFQTAVIDQVSKRRLTYRQRKELSKIRYNFQEIRTD